MGVKVNMTGPVSWLLAGNTL